MTQPQAPVHDPSSILQIQTFIDSAGREISARTLLDAGETDYLGQIILTELDENRQPIRQIPLRFDIQASDIKEAFVRFDEAAQEAYAESVAAQTKARHDAAGKILLPG
jgi:hypothetical protein